MAKLRRVEIPRRTMLSRSMALELANRPPILALPNELLAEILKRALSSLQIARSIANPREEGYYRTFCGYRTHEDDALATPGNVLSVCRRFFEVGQPAFYSETIFFMPTLETTQMLVDAFAAHHLVLISMVELMLSDSDDAPMDYAVDLVSMLDHFRITFRGRPAAYIVFRWTRRGDIVPLSGLKPLLNLNRLDVIISMNQFEHFYPMTADYRGQRRGDLDFMRAICNADRDLRGRPPL